MKYEDSLYDALRYICETRQGSRPVDWGHSTLRLLAKSRKQPEDIFLGTQKSACNKRAYLIKMITNKRLHVKASKLYRLVDVKVGERTSACVEKEVVAEHTLNRLLEDFHTRGGHKGINTLYQELTGRYEGIHYETVRDFCNQMALTRPSPTTEAIQLKMERLTFHGSWKYSGYGSTEADMKFNTGYFTLEKDSSQWKLLLEAQGKVCKTLVLNPEKAKKASSYNSTVCVDFHCGHTVVFKAGSKEEAQKASDTCQMALTSPSPTTATSASNMLAKKKLCMASRKQATSQAQENPEPETQAGQDQEQPQNAEQKVALWKKPENAEQKVALWKKRPPVQLTETQELEVAEWVKDHPILYNMATPDFNDKAMREKMWFEKAEELHIPLCVLNCWYRGIRKKFGKLPHGYKSGDGAIGHTERDERILKIFSFLSKHIVRKPSSYRAAINAKIAKPQLQPEPKTQGSDNDEILDEDNTMVVSRVPSTSSAEASTSTATQPRKKRKMEEKDLITAGQEMIDQKLMNYSYGLAPALPANSHVSWGHWITACLPDIHDSLWTDFQQESFALVTRYQAESRHLQQLPHQQLPPHQQLLPQHPPHQQQLPPHHHQLPPHPQHLPPHQQIFHTQPGSDWVSNDTEPQCDTGAEMCMDSSESETELNEEEIQNSEHNYSINTFCINIEPDTESRVKIKPE